MSIYKAIDDMMWPSPGKEMDDLEWRLRYGEPSNMDLILAACIISAYRQIIQDPAKKRQMVVAKLREAV